MSYPLAFQNCYLFIEIKKPKRNYNLKCEIKKLYNQTREEKRKNSGKIQYFKSYFFDFTHFKQWEN